jgi:hypothetical protein
MNMAMFTENLPLYRLQHVAVFLPFSPQRRQACVDVLLCHFPIDHDWCMLFSSLTCYGVDGTEYGGWDAGG